MADDATDALYALPLEEFVPARDALARELRRDKRRDEAAEVAALQKPTRPAWMVNQLSRTEGALTAKLLECAEALAEAQEAAVSGQGARDLRAASRSERQAVDQLMNAARGLRPEGRSPSAAMLERVRVTLQAAAGDEELRERIRHGRLVEEPAAGGAWPLPGWGGDAAEVDEAPKKAGGRRAAKRSRGDAADADETPKESAGRRSATGRATKRSRDDHGRTGTPARSRTAKPRRPKEAKSGEEAAEGAATEAERRQAREDAERERAAAAERRTELERALRAAKKAARDAVRERERARHDADRAAERLERLAAEAAAAQEAADGAATRRDETEAAAEEAEAEVARIEAELRGR